MSDSKGGERPKIFDETVVKYRRYLIKRSIRLVGWDDAEDLAQSAIARSLDNWRGWKGDCHIMRWVVWQLLAEFDNMRRANRISSQSSEIDEVVVTESPRQETVTEASLLVEKISSIKGGDVTLEYALGNSMQEIGEKRNVSRQRIHMIHKGVMAEIDEAINNPRAD